MNIQVKRNYPLLILLAVLFPALVLGLGNLRIISYTVRGALTPKTDVYNITNNIDLFDTSLVHSIKIEMPEADYKSMVATYQQTGSKSYFHADVTIDGMRVKNVGIRLKGNASLRTAVGGRMGGFNRGGQDNNPPAQPAQPALPFQPDGGGGQGRPNPGGGIRPPSLNPEQPQAAPPSRSTPEGSRADGAPEDLDAAQGQPPQGQIPFMLKFDQFVTGQSYQGLDRLAIRSAGISYDASMLHEPVTNSVFRLVGQPATETAYAGISVNNSTEQLFSISEVIDKDYLGKYFQNNGGILYKAEFNSRLTYLGDDPSAYARSFTQETREYESDLAPLIRFLKFISQSDESTFEKELPAWLDVDSFATYLAVNNLLVNTDSMAGMGNNFYLYYDSSNGRMTVLMWDANESLGKINMNRGGGDSASYDIYYKGQSGGFGGMAASGGSNTLVTRFFASDTFMALYEQKLQLVYQKAFVSQAMIQQIERYTAMVRSENNRRNFVDPTRYENAVKTVQSFIQRRGAYLGTTPLLGKQTGLNR